VAAARVARTCPSKGIGGWWKAVVPELIANLKDESAKVRGWSIEALGAFGSDAAEAVPDLMKLLANGPRTCAARQHQGTGTP
jgi:HEAT repeats